LRYEGGTDLKHSIDQLIGIMKCLRDPDNGCPWDVEQTFATIAPHTIEEAYEVADAIAHDDMADLKDELGDLLFQVVFHSQMASERGAFDLDDVVNNVSAKMIRRHPHVFGDGSIDSPEAQTRAWEDIKAEERTLKGKARLDGAGGDVDRSALSGVISALPELIRAQKLQKRAARVGFDWPEAKQVFDKIHEEIGEIEAEMTDIPDPARLEDEIGDLLFVCVNLARKLGIEAETALRGGNAKFERRFRHMETIAAEKQVEFSSLPLDEMELLWVDAKTRD
jgi:nucleoside triphosphate diphosphatase